MFNYWLPFKLLKCLFVLIAIVHFHSVQSQSNEWIDSGNPNFQRADLSFSDKHSFQGNTSLHIKGRIAPISDNVSLENNSIEICLKNELEKALDWSMHEFITLDVYMEESLEGLSEVRLGLTNSKGQTSYTTLILGWQLQQWENYHMTFPLTQNAYDYGNIAPEVLKDVVNVHLAFYRFSDEVEINPYTEVNFHIDNMKIDGYKMWDNFEDKTYRLSKDKFNDERVDFKIPNSNFILGIDKEKGHIHDIKNADGQELSSGNLDKTLWSVKCNSEGPLASFSSYNFNSKFINTTFSFDDKSGIWLYRSLDADNKLLFELKLQVKTITEDEIRFSTEITNNLRIPIRSVILLDKLSMPLKRIESGLWPIQEGILLLPSFFKENRQSVMSRPPMSSDVLALKMNQGVFGSYLVQDSEFHSALLPNSNGNSIFQPSLLHMGGANNFGFFCFELLTCIENGEKWQSPSIHLSLSKTYLNLLNSYKNNNGFGNIKRFPLLASKFDDRASYQQFKKSPLYTIELFKTIEWKKAQRGNVWEEIKRKWLPTIKTNGIIHLTHWQYGRDDHIDKRKNHRIEDDHPDALPIWEEKYGDHNSLLSMISFGKTKGFKFMPFSNYTIWNKMDINATKEEYKTHVFAKQTRGPFYEYKEYNGFMIKPWSLLVQNTNDTFLKRFKTEFDQDYVFVDMTAERGPRYILSDDNIGSTSIYTQAIINENERLAKKTKLFTEGVFDYMMNGVVGFNQTLRQKRWNGVLAYLGDEGKHWLPFPIAASIMHENVAFYQHNLNTETWPAMSLALQSYYTLFGYNYNIDLTTHFGEDEEKMYELAIIQSLVNSRTCGEALLHFDYLNASKNQMISQWNSENPLTIIGNFNFDKTERFFSYNDVDIAPDGFYAFSEEGDIIGGYFVNKFLNERLDNGIHGIFIEKNVETIDVFYIKGKGTPITIPKRLNVRKKQITVVRIEKDGRSIMVPFKCKNNSISFDCQPNALKYQIKYH